MGIFDRDAERTTDRETDAQALARYRYMLATAPPEDIERAHEEAFAKLTPEQRAQALDALAHHVPQNEIHGDDPASLARTATRAEIREPGTIQRAWGGNAPGFGLGSWFLSTLAGSFIGTAIAQSFFDSNAGAGDAGADAGSGADAGWSGSDADATDAGSGDFGDGGDLGGGDFGGGDFGDFGGI